MNMFYREKPFVAIIGDIRNSRDIEGRNRIQEKLRDILGKINVKYRENIAADFIITLGDEFQGLLGDGKELLQIIYEIKIQLYPVEVRFGIGIGRITTNINREMALGADGPAYYCARNAIEILEENERKNKVVTSDIRLEKEEGEIGLVNTTFELLGALEQDWTNRQREIIWDVFMHQDGQKKAAVRLGITQPTVQKALKTGNYYVYEKAIRDLARTLEGL